MLQRLFPRLETLYRLFLISCGVILSLTAAAKIVSAAGHASILREMDPLLKVPNGALLYFVAAAELVVVMFILFGRSLMLKMISVAWLSLSFAAYRIVNAVMGIKTCPCLGHITDNLPLRPSTVSALLVTSLAYMWY